MVRPRVCQVPAQVHLGSKSIEHVESGRDSGGCIRVKDLYHAVSTRGGGMPTGKVFLSRGWHGQERD